MAYPKMLYLVGWADTSAHCVVNSPEEEESARGQGYKDMEECVACDDVEDAVVVEEKPKPAAKRRK